MKMAFSQARLSVQRLAQRRRDAEIQRYRDTEIQRYRDTEIQRYRDTEIQRYRDTEIQRYRDTEAGGLAYFGSSFDSGSITSALARFDPTSTGAVAVDNFANANFNFGSLDLSLGALDDVTYGGVLSPGSGGYRIGGGPGTITFTGENAFTGSNSLIVAGRVIITNANNLSGTTTILPGGRLQIGAGGTGAAQGSLPASSIENNGSLAFNRTDKLTPGTDFKSPISGTGSVEQSGAGSLLLNAANTYEGGTTLVSGSLILGNATAIGTGPLSLYSGLLDVDSAFAGPLTLTGNNRINLSANFTFGGTEDLNLGSGAVNIYGSPSITLNGDSDLTLAGVVTNASGSTDSVQTLTVNGAGNTLVLGGYKMSNDEYATNINLVIDGTADVVITGPIDDLSGDDAFEENYGGLIKTGTGTLTLYGDNKHTGDTVVESGVLQIESGTQKSPITVNDGGILGFTLGSTADEKTIISSQRLTLNEGHKIRIENFPVSGAETTYILMTASSIGGVAPELEVLITDYELQIDGNSLILTNTADQTSPVLTDIVDDQNGGTIVSPDTLGSIPRNTLVTYTVTFNEEIHPDTVTASDFDNNPGLGDPSTITIGDIIQIAPGTFTVQVTPTSVGSLQLRIPTTASITDLAGNMLDSDPALLDDTEILVKDPYAIWFAGGQFDGDTNGDGIANGLAWLLGAFDVNEDASGLLPVAEIEDDKLKISFITLDTASRGSASMKVQHSGDLGANDNWEDNEAEVPDVDSTVNGIEFKIQPFGGGYIQVEALIPMADSSRFIRVSGTVEAP